MSDLSFYKRLSLLQSELIAPKNNYNSFGKYHYRSAEDVLEAVKPLNQKYDLLLFIKDEPVLVGDWHYIKATATLIDTRDPTNQIFSSAYARESENRKGQDDSQITGTASSYARKYALNGLYLIDDTKDADTDEFKQQTQKEESKNCNKKSNINTIKAKYEAGKGSLEGFDQWYKDMRSKGVTDQQIEAILTESLKKKQTNGGR